MCNLLPIRRIIYCAIVLGILVFLTFCFYHKPVIGVWEYIQIGLQAAGITTFIVTGFAKFNLWRYIWNLRPTYFNRKIFPDLQGRYSGTLSSSYDNSQIHENIELMIDQSLTKITVYLYTTASTSYSESAQIVACDKNETGFQLHYFYNNVPKNAERPEIQPHNGFAILDIDLSGKQLRLTGRYFNDSTMRKTYGDMDFTRYQTSIQKSSR